MHCKHLLHYSNKKNTWAVDSCAAKNTPYVPDLFELESFCQSGRHNVCPAYLLSYRAGELATESPIPVAWVG